MLNDGYYCGERKEVLNLIPNLPKNVLELGCGEGVFGELVKKKYQCNVTGIDIFAKATEKAKDKLDTVYTSSIEEFDFTKLGKFDLIIANDLLEHLKDPWDVVNLLHDNLEDNGYFVASIPNVCYHKVLTGLLKGNWQYTESGILDKTHLRFFTKKTMINLFNDNGYIVKLITPINIDKVNITNVLKLILKGLMPDMYALQYTIIAQKL